MNVPSRQPTATGRWTRALWLLSLLFGGVTIWSMVSLEHDTGRLDTAAAAMLQPRADAAIRLAENRLRLQRQTLAAVATPGDAKKTAQSIVGLYARATRCQCLNVIPAAWLWVRASNDSVPVIVSLTSERLTPATYDAMTARARRSITHADGSPQMLMQDPAPSDTVEVTQMLRDSVSGLALDIGLVGEARAMAQGLFALDPVDMERPHQASDLRVFADGARLLHGATISPTALRAEAASAQLGGWTAVVAVAPQRIASVLMDETARYRLWHLGLQMLLTVVAVALAARSSRAELRLLRARSDFVAGVSHDLRMPLAEVLLAAETLTIEHDASADRRAALTRTVLREARRVIGMIENVLLFARADLTPDTAAVARKETIEVAALLSDTAEGAAMAAEAAEQTIVIADLPTGAAALRVRGDERLLRQALGNFVDNALKYGAPGQTITLGASRESAAWVVLTVDDQGPGIPQADRVRVLQPYERLLRDRDSTRTGSGLGLAVATQIARLSGGSLHLDDGPGGRGTRVRLRLPSAERTMTSEDA